MVQYYITSFDIKAHPLETNTFVYFFGEIRRLAGVLAKVALVDVVLRNVGPRVTNLIVVFRE